MSGTIYSLVDANNFYASCERVFRPSLRDRPIVVLSNNDGCVIARSNEAKALNIRMGQPWFEVRHLVEDAGVVALSANFTLYGDLSDRIMSLAAGLGPRQEIYSIDECFVELTGVPGDLTVRAQRVRERILQWTGIPCGVGIGATKTLAKLANHIAKSADRKPGSYPAHHARVCNLALLDACELDALLDRSPASEIWGIGPRITQQLAEVGIRTALDVKRLDVALVRERWSVVLERTVRELQGVPCMGLDDEPAPKQEIACTRSFGNPVTTLQDLSEAVTEFASRAAEKLRRQHSHAGAVLTFIRTSPFRRNDRQFSGSLVVPLRRATADTPAIVQAALAGLSAIFRPDYRWAKAGVMLLELQPQGLDQGELELDDPRLAPVRDRSRIMGAVDGLNERYGRGTVMLASAGLKGDQRTWSMKQERRTPAYTTCWEEMPVARA